MEKSIHFPLIPLYNKNNNNKMKLLKWGLPGTKVDRCTLSLVANQSNELLISIQISKFKKHINPLDSAAKNKNEVSFPETLFLVSLAPHLGTRASSSLAHSL